MQSIKATSEPLQPIPDGLVVLTFDDSVKSQATFAAPLLRQHGFGATFFVTDDPRFRGEHYMTWEEIRHLYEAGFEIGNHSGRHVDVSKESPEQFSADLAIIEQRCQQHGLPRPTTFCYPAYHSSQEAVQVLLAKGYHFARRGVYPEFPYNQEGGRGPAYDAKVHHPLLIPTTGASGPNWGFDDLVWAVQQARDGEITVLTFHGVPDLEHPWVHTEPDMFLRYMEYLHAEGCKVIAMRDLIEYISPIVYDFCE
jgi:peptidoglycan/xylan/chitin deacetylase (PgdA/CDA1 family)